MKDFLFSPPSGPGPAASDWPEQFFPAERDDLIFVIHPPGERRRLSPLTPSSPLPTAAP
eukprot:CAMPEP_0172528652 /NCGR_PEP_ID=MMETSP1067-20121228/2981_1 /TAXON_ID=265564 ORGANISM="Thalassiosira punctigera, Strain Tpunct2005C2" /NCGR_SAMPLE_ID=MMETSP1067 /ASSEMBLY_ACC=CAM_ASM_000444 /LENGTH=58 /DNA_ID=CAMNT_0013312603 /DNA_START=140 /DNA_END=313 /DNA_ORIENTATION=-